MQHTLLPLTERRLLRREYRTRVLIVLAFMMSGVGAVGIGALFPAYLRAVMAEKNGNATVASLQKGKDESGITEIENALNRDSRFITAMSSASSTGSLRSVKYSNVIQSLGISRGQVKIKSISMDKSKEKGGGVSVLIQGTAPTRDALLLFKSRIEQLSPGSTINIPLSTLAKSKDIQFSFSFIYQIR